MSSGPGPGKARQGQGRVLLRQIHQLGLTDIGADAELDIVQPGTALAEFYQLSMAALAEPMISAGVMTPDQAARLAARPGDLTSWAAGSRSSASGPENRL